MKVKFISAILFALFALFAWFQYNDPDPVLWIFLYGSVAVISLMRIFGYYFHFTTVCVMIIIGVYAATLIPGIIEYFSQPNKEELFGEMYKNKPYIEESREFFGLVIAELALFFHVKTRNLTS